MTYVSDLISEGTHTIVALAMILIPIITLALFFKKGRDSMLNSIFIVLNFLLMVSVLFIVPGIVAACRFVWVATGPRPTNKATKQH